MQAVTYFYKKKVHRAKSLIDKDTDELRALELSTLLKTKKNRKKYKSYFLSKQASGRWTAYKKRSLERRTSRASFAELA